MFSWKANGDSEDPILELLLTRNDWLVVAYQPTYVSLDLSGGHSVSGLVGLLPLVSSLRGGTR